MWTCRTPNFAIHLNYWDFKNPEIVAMVREGDAVAIKKGYHYNVAAPGTVTTFPLDDGRHPGGTGPRLHPGYRSAGIRRAVQAVLIPPLIHVPQKSRGDS